MILSMTGYGRAQQTRNGRDITVELRSVNSRFLEYSSRLPRALNFLEDPLKKLVAARVHRGKVELSLTVQNTQAPDTVGHGELGAGQGLPGCHGGALRTAGTEKRP